MGRHSKSGSVFGGPGDKGPHRPARRRAPKRMDGASPLQPGAARSTSDVYHLSDSASRKRGPLESAPERLRVERERRVHRNRRIAAGIAIGLVAVIVLGGVGVFAWAKHIEHTMQQTVYKHKAVKLTLKKAQPLKPFTILLLGGDDKPGTTAHRTDTIILAKIDPVQKKVWMLSIPRDTRAAIPGHDHSKINKAYFYGGPELTIKTVEQFTGVEINHYMEVDYRGFKQVVDALGGVWVNVPTEINDPKAAGQSYKRQAAHIDAGYQLLDGDHALVFCRSRAYVDADFSRMKHQQLFFRALADQIASKESVAKLPRVVAAAAPSIGTDMSLMEIIRTAQALKSAGSKNLYTATIMGEWRSPFVWTDEAKKTDLLQRFKEGRPFEDTTATAGAAGTAGGTSASSANAASGQPKALSPKDITVDVRNGAGIAGCAKQAASILRAQAFQVGDVGNSQQFVYDHTLIVYRSNKAAAEKVAQSMPPGTKLVESRGMYSFKGDVLLVIGKDWNISRIPVTPIVQ